MRLYCIHFIGSIFSVNVYKMSTTGKYYGDNYIWEYLTVRKCSMGVFSSMPQSSDTASGHDIGIAGNTDELFKRAVERSILPLIKNTVFLGVDINVEIENGNTALHIAAEKCDSPVIKILLLANNLDINKKNHIGITPLMKACIFNCREVVQLLLKKGANPNIYSNDGNGPLHFACARRNVGIVFDLVQRGAKINIRNVFDVTPLSVSVIDFPSLAIAKYLLKKAGKKHDSKEFPLLLECALSCNSLKRLHTFEILVNKGMDIHQLHPLEHRNCLHYVAISSYLPLVNFLLTLDVEEDLAICDATGRTPLDIALSHENYTVFHLFRYYLYLKFKARESSTSISEQD